MPQRNLKKLVLNILPSAPTIYSKREMPQTISNSTQDMDNDISVIYQKGPACIMPNLYLGACYNALNAAQLTCHGITCIINVASEINISVPMPHIEYHHMKWKHNQPDLAESEFDRAIELIRTAHSHNHIVLIHCQQGIERSAALILAFFLKITRCVRRVDVSQQTTELGNVLLSGQNWSLGRALSFIKEKAPNIRPNMELLYQLQEYEQSLLSLEQRPLLERRHNRQNRAKRSESVSCSKSSTGNNHDALLAFWPHHHQYHHHQNEKAVCKQRPRSASLRDISSSANISFSTLNTTSIKTPHTSSRTADRQPLAVIALVIVFVAIYQRKCDYSNITAHSSITTSQYHNNYYTTTLAMQPTITTDI